MSRTTCAMCRWAEDGGRGRWGVVQHMLQGGALSIQQVFSMRTQSAPITSLSLPLPPRCILTHPMTWFAVHCYVVPHAIVST